MGIRQFAVSHWIALAVLGVGLMFTSAFGWWARAHEQERVGASVDRHAAVVVEAVAGAVHDILKDSAASAGLFEASEEVTEDEWHQFASRIGHPPGSLGLAHVAIVPAEALEAHEAEARHHHPDYAVFVVEADGSRAGVDAGEVFYPVRYFVPAFSGSPALLGFDAASDPAWAQALTAATASPEPVISRLGPVPLASAGPGFVAVAAIRAEGEVQGFTVVVALLDRMVEAVIAGSLREVVDWTVSDVPGPAGRSDDPYLRVEQTQVGGRVWRVEVTPTDEARADLAVSPWRPALLLGLVLSVLAAIAAHLATQVVRSAREKKELRRLTGEKDEFLAAVSHELRTPLTAVVGMAEILAENLDESVTAENPQIGEYLTMLRSEAWELARLVEDVLLLGRLETGTLAVEPTSVEVRWEASRVVTELDPPDRVSIEIEGHARAWADPLRLRQILRNLISNALGHGGEDITVEIFETQSQAKVRVSDDGSGVAPDQVPGLFSASIGAKHTAGGPSSLGLGLRISYRLALALGGGLEYRRENGTTVFELRLPRPRVVTLESAEHTGRLRHREDAQRPE